MIYPIDIRLVFTLSCAILFLVFLPFGISAQDLATYSKAELEAQLDRAVSAQNYQLAGTIQRELESRLSYADKARLIEQEMDKAVDDQNFQLAASLKERLELCLHIDSLEQQIAFAAKNQDFNKAAALKEEKDEAVGRFINEGHKEITEVRNHDNVASEGIRKLNFSTTEPINGFAEPREGKSVVYFVAESGGGMIPKYECFHEDQYIGYIKQKRYIRFECDPGQHLFWVSSENKEFLTANLLPNRIYVVRVAFVIGAWKSHPGFRIDHDKKDLEKIEKYIRKDEALHFTQQHIKEKNEEFKGFIKSNLKRYKNETKDRYNFKQLEANMYYR